MNCRYCEDGEALVTGLACGVCGQNGKDSTVEVFMKTYTATDDRFVVQWNYGRSQCGFDDLKSMAEFIAKELPKFVEPQPMPDPDSIQPIQLCD